MTQGPDDQYPPPNEQPGQQPGQQSEPPQPGPPQPGSQPPPPPGWQQPPPGWQPPPQPGWAPPGGYYPPNPAAPYGVHPRTGVPYSDKSRIVAGVLQLVVPLGIGRFYMGYTGLGVAQLLVTIFTCGVGALWPFIDGILILVNDDVTDVDGRPLRPS
jgi:TM2 domain-containing membrane protein YozV